MLGKLLKYEFRATMRTFLPMYLATIAFALLSRLFSEVSSLQNLWDGRIFALISFVYIIVIIMTLALTFVMIIQRFYKSLLKDEGYLSNTLPVSVDTHIWGKVIPATAWTIMCTLIILISVIPIISAQVNMSELWNAFNEGISAFGRYHEIPFWLFITEIAVVGVLNIISNILAFYSAMTIGQLFNNHKAFLSVVAYFGLNIIFIIFLSAVSNIYFETSAFDTYTIITTSSWSTLMALVAISCAVQGAIHYFITRYILKNRLNLE